jgi:cytoskeletal protein CcmA (bactofilin family)
MLTTGGLTIKGQLLADEDVRIEGSFEGTIEVRGHSLSIASSAHVRANVVTHRLELAEGAEFNGSVNTDRARAAIEVARHRVAGTVTP